MAVLGLHFFCALGQLFSGLIRCTRKILLLWVMCFSFFSFSSFFPFFSFFLFFLLFMLSSVPQFCFLASEYVLRASLRRYFNMRTATTRKKLDRDND